MSLMEQLKFHKESYEYIKLLIQEPNKILGTIYNKTKLINIIREKTNRNKVLVYAYLIDEEHIHIVLRGKHDDIKECINEVNEVFSKLVIGCSHKLFNNCYEYLNIKDDALLKKTIGYIHQLKREYTNRYDVISYPNSYHEYNGTIKVGLISNSIKDIYSKNTFCEDLLKPSPSEHDKRFSQMKKNKLDKVIVKEASTINSDGVLLDESADYM